MSLDAHELFPGLWQGSYPKPADWPELARRFDAVVYCAREKQPLRTPPAIAVVRAPLDDGPPPTKFELGIAASAARDVTMRVRRGERVLVTCAKGLNRSGLVSALSLARLTGASGRACTQRVQERRPGALFNRYFCAALAALPRKDARR